MLWNRKSINRIITEVGDIIMAEELTKFAKALPANIEDLSTFVVVGREKLVALQAELRAISKVGMVEEIRKQKLSEAQDLADELLLAEVRLGELISALPEMRGKRTDLQQPMDTDVQMSKKEVLQKNGINIRTAARYEMLASHPEIIYKMSREARNSGEIISRTTILKAIAKKPFVINNSGNTEWYTPKQYIASARKVMGSIDLDPASSKQAQTIVNATLYYDINVNGLTKEWKGNIWLNPPYSNVKLFVDKLLDSTFDQAIVLVNNATETEWFARLAERASAMVFHLGRIRFATPESEGEGTTPCMQGQVFVYFGPTVEKYLEEFSQYGWGVKL